MKDVTPRPGEREPWWLPARHGPALRAVGRWLAALGWALLISFVGF